MKTTLKKENFALWYDKALDFMDHEDFEKASHALDFALALDKDHLYALVLKGSAALVAGEYEASRRALVHAIGLGADGFNVYYIKARACIELERYEEALEALDRALFLNADESEAWYYRAFALGCLGRYEESLEAYDEAMDSDPDNIDLLCYKGFALCELGRYDEAQKLFRKCLARDPNHVLALLNASERWLVAGDTAKALAAARKAAKVTVETDFILIGSWLVIAAYALGGNGKKMREELAALVKYVRSLERAPEVGDWSFECMTGTIRKKLRDPKRKLLLALIDLLSGRLSLSGFEKLLAPKPRAKKIRR